MNISRYLLTAAILILILTVSTGCTGPIDEPDPEAVDPELETVTEESRVLGEMGETAANLPGEVEITGLGTFSFDPGEVSSLRDDIFREGHFSIFDVLVHLEQTGRIDMEYHFDESLNTYVISNMNDISEWWYDAYYDGGWPERSVFRMDHYPYKDKMSLEFVPSTTEYLESVYETYRDEVRRREENDGKLVIPDVYIRGDSEQWHFENVEVEAHNLRGDMFQPGVITAIDTIITLGEAGEFSYDLQWYESLGTAGVVKSYWVNRINDDESQGRCGFVYEAGNEEFRFFRGNHNHIPSDARVINSPQYLEYFWICI